VVVATTAAAAIDPVAVGVSLAALALAGSVLVHVPAAKAWRRIVMAIGLAAVFGVGLYAQQATISAEVPGLVCEPPWVFFYFWLCF
jgi:hypothetical protein